MSDIVFMSQVYVTVFMSMERSVGIKTDCLLVLVTVWMVQTVLTVRKAWFYGYSREKGVVLWLYNREKGVILWLYSREKGVVLWLYRRGSMVI